MRGVWSEGGAVPYRWEVIENLTRCRRAREILALQSVLPFLGSRLIRLMFGGLEGTGMISFVIPAHNEAELIGRTLSAMYEAARTVEEPYEVIVVDDASTDRTSLIAREHGARVVSVNFRKIAATRNAGARVAAGDLLFFVDADTMVTGRAVRAAVRSLRAGAVGGGSAVRFDGPVPLYAAILERMVLPIVLPLFKMAPGCFLFCTRRAYLAAGGFDETLFWAEEVAFGNRLKRQGRFVMLRDFVITSGRKLRATSALGLFRVGARLALGQRTALDFWYGPRMRIANSAAEPLSI